MIYIWVSVSKYWIIYNHILDYMLLVFQGFSHTIGIIGRVFSVGDGGEREPPFKGDRRTGGWGWVLLKDSLDLLACMCAQSLSRVRLFVTLWTIAHQAPLSMEFSRQGYWLPFPALWDHLDPGIKPMSHVSPALTGGFFTPGKPLGLLRCC